MKIKDSNFNYNSDTSAVICTKNCEHIIEEVLISVVKNHPLEIIVVDGKSTDNTRAIAEKYATRILTDPGKGLAIARNIGLKEAKGEYIFYNGSDNVIVKNTLTKLKEYLKKNNYIGTSALTRIRNEKHSYFTRGLNIRWKLRFFEGPRDVIGTPVLYKTEILRKYQFDPKMSWSDDSDLAVKLKKDGYRVGYSNVICWEIGFENMKTILKHFRMYGKSDYEYYIKYSSDWKLKRKIKSILHPLQAEFIDPIKRLKNVKILYYLPFFLLITVFRYRGYIGFAIRRGKDKEKK